MGSNSEMIRFNNLRSRIDAVYHIFSLKAGVSDNEAKVLYTLCSLEKKMPLDDILQDTGLKSQSLNAVLRKLKKERIIHLETSDGKPANVSLTEKGKEFVNDGKPANVSLTEKGKEFVNKTGSRLIEVENSIFQSWPRGDVEKYLYLTERFLTSLRERVRKL